MLAVSAGTLQGVAAVLTGVAVVLLGILFLAPDRSVERDISGRLGSYGQTARSTTWMSRVPVLRRFAREAEEEAERRGVLTVLSNVLEQANLPLTPGEALLAALAGSLILGLLAGAIFSSVVIGVIVAAAGMLFVLVGLQQLAARERRRFENQLPDTLNLLATSLRAGYSLLQAVEAVAREASDPTHREFNRGMSDIRLGIPVPTALRGVATRMGSVDFEWAVMAVDIQREVGGNLAEVLTTTSETILQRHRLRREVRALTAEGRFSAFVLVMVPVILFVFIYGTNRDYLDPLLNRTGGRLALLGAGALMVAGVIWMRRIIDIKV